MIVRKLSQSVYIFSSQTSAPMIIMAVLISISISISIRHKRVASYTVLFVADLWQTKKEKISPVKPQVQMAQGNLPFQIPGRARWDNKNAFISSGVSDLDLTPLWTAFQ